MSFVEELSQMNKSVIINFHKTIPISRILVSLSIIDDIFLKILVDVVENIIDKIRELKENILYMLSFEILIREEEANKTVS